MLSSATVVSGKGSTTAVVSGGDIDELVVVLVEVITGEEVVDLFGTGINTATELSSIIVGFPSVLSLSELFSRALIAFSIAFVNASWSNASGFCFGCSAGSVGLVIIEFIGCGVVKNGSPVKSSVISEKSNPAVVLKSQSGTDVGVNWNGVVKSMIIGGA